MYKSTIIRMHITYYKRPYHLLRKSKPPIIKGSSIKCVDAFRSALT